MEPDFRVEYLHINNEVSFVGLESKEEGHLFLGDLYILYTHIPKVLL